MKEIVEAYVSYNAWANERLLDAALKMDSELLKKELPSSFPGIPATFFHIWYAEYIWWQRIKLIERVDYPQPDDLDLSLIAFNLKTQSAKWKEWVARSSEASLLHEVAYYNSKKEFFKSEIWKVLLHMVNHGTYHRGQIVTMFHQLDQKNIPATDFIYFNRKQKR